MKPASWIATGGTILIGAGAFTLSFAALTDLARRAGFATPLQSVVWALVVDGIILCATTAVVALKGSNGIRYAWTLLGCGAAVSIAANVIHPLLPAGPIPPLVAAAVALVPPLALLATTHLTVILGRPRASGEAPSAAVVPQTPSLVSVPNVPVEVGDVPDDADINAASAPPVSADASPRAAQVAALRREGLTYKQIAGKLNISERTARRDAAA